MIRFARCMLFFICASIWLACSAFADNSRVQVQFRNANGSESPSIRAEVVATEATRSYGLMYRKVMGETEGMLFLFPRERELSFWMKNTYLELDIIFIDKNWKVVSVSEYATPLSETLRKSRGPAQYVVEVLAGRARQWGIRPGSEVVVQGTLPNPT